MCVCVCVCVSVSVSVCVSVCVSVSVCLSIKSNLSSGVSVRPKNVVTYSVGNVDRKIGGVFSNCFIPELWHFLHCAATVKLAIFSLGIQV